MSFRQYGGINYAARNNIVKTNFTNASNLSIMNKVGQPDSKINVESTLDVYAINLTSPTITTNQNGVVPKSYVDVIGGGLKPKLACQCATVGPLSGNANPTVGTYPGLSIDSFPLVPLDRVLIKNQEDTSSTYLGSVYNGIYVYSSAGTFSRADDYVVGDDAYGAYVLVTGGTTNGNKSFIEINEGTVGLSVLLFTQFSASISVGQGLEKVTNGSSTVVQVKSDLSTSPFITSLAVSGSITTSSASIGGGALTISSSGLASSVPITSTSTVSGATLQSSGNIYLTNTSAFILTSTAGANLSVGTQSGGGLYLNANSSTGILITGTAITNYLSTTFLSPPICSVSATTGTQLVNKSYVDLTFQTLTGMSLYLTTSAASITYQTLAGMSNYALLASPILTGVPTAPTATAGTNNTQVATTAYVQTVIGTSVNPQTWGLTTGNIANAGGQLVGGARSVSYNYSAFFITPVQMGAVARFEFTYSVYGVKSATNGDYTLASIDQCGGASFPQVNNPNTTTVFDVNIGFQAPVTQHSNPYLTVIQTTSNYWNTTQTYYPKNAPTTPYTFKPLEFTYNALQSSPKTLTFTFGFPQNISIGGNNALGDMSCGCASLRIISSPPSTANEQDAYSSNTLGSASAGSWYFQ
jgi:hypothetical protein